MRFYRKLYASESMKKKRRQIAWKLKTRKFMPSIYIIALPEGESNLLEIYHSALLKQPYYKKNDIFVVGVAGDYNEALSIMQDILNDTKKAVDSYDVRKFVTL